MTPSIKENTFITSFHYPGELNYWLAVQFIPQPVKALSMNGLLISLRFIHPEEENCIVCQNIKKSSLLCGLIPKANKVHIIITLLPCSQEK
jgi:hypothetical protein